MRNYDAKAGSPADEAERTARDREDTEWLQALARGDLGALEPLYVRYRAVVLTALRRHGRADPGELEDLCQEVFLSLTDLAGTFRHASTVRAFLVGIAIKKSAKLRFRTSLHRRLIDRVLGRATPAVQGHGASDARHDLERLLAQLPEAQRTVLLLHRVEHLSAEEIAAALSISVNTVWTRLHRARQRLRELEASEP